MPDVPESTSPALTKSYHIDAATIAKSVCLMLDKTIDVSPLHNNNHVPHDVPGEWFKGPF